MAEALIQALNITDAGRYWRGDIIQVYEDGALREPPSPTSGKVILKVPGLSFAEFEQQRAEWWLRLAYTVVSSNLAADSFRLRVAATDFHPVSGMGKLLPGVVDTFLTNWGAANITTADNAVTFDITILNAIKSQNFWRGWDIAGITLAETKYTQSTGAHRCSINYSGGTVEVTQILSAIAETGGSIVSRNDTAKIIVFDVTRADVRQRFEDDVRRRTEKMVVRRKFALKEAAMQLIEADPQKWLTVSIAQYNTFWKNKLTE